MTLDRRAELGEFLRSRRSRIEPDELGLTDLGGRRSAPGLLREELAMLAGVSVDHYVRLERGRTLHFSEEVLDAVARALCLDAADRDRLYRLARPWSAADHPDAVQPQQVRPGLQRLLDSAPDVPAYIVGRACDVLVWNRLAAALITDFGALAPEQRNLARLVVLDEGMRNLYGDWEGQVRDIAAVLRLDVGRNPDDPRLAGLVEELSEASPEFAAAWAAEHEAGDRTHGRYVYRHPVVGELRLQYESLQLPGEPDQALVMHVVEEGSPSEIALMLLASWAQSSVAVD